MVVIIDVPPYELKGKLKKQGEIIGSAMVANNVRKAPLGKDGDRQLYLIWRHADDHKEVHVIGTTEYPEIGSFLIADAV